MKKSALIFVWMALLLLLPLCSLAAETPWGKVPVAGNKEETAGKGGRMWAPINVKLTDDPYALGDVYLEYRYVRFDSKTRAWQMKLVDKEGNTYPYTGHVSITFPYPCKWDYRTGQYWKWTKEYASNFQWAYAVITNTCYFSYEKYNGSYAVAGHIVRGSIQEITGEAARKDKESGKTGENIDDELIEKYQHSMYEHEEHTANSLIGELIKLGFDTPEDPENSMKFKVIEPVEKDGHRIGLTASNGILQTVCIEIFETKPSYNKCKLEVYLGSRTFGGILQVDYYSIIEFEGFLVDTRPKEFKENPNYLDFLNKHKNSFGIYLPLSRPNNLQSNNLNSGTAKGLSDHFLGNFYFKP